MSIEISDIAQHWGVVQIGLQAIKRKTKAAWSLEDVYNHCANGEWLLFTEPGVDGFLMVSVQRCQYSGTIRLEVNCAYHRGAIDPTDQYLPFLKLLAREVGATEIEARSPRRGWERKGFKPVDIVYRMEV